MDHHSVFPASAKDFGDVTDLLFDVALQLCFGLWLLVLRPECLLSLTAQHSHSLGDLVAFVVGFAGVVRVDVLLGFGESVGTGAHRYAFLLGAFLAIGCRNVLLAA